ncbi:MAG: 23S rRNA (adenine(2030)-N(6))-methyltransferase RlmJ [Aquabacterium sp.]|jgi:23S rRNA (adenine2030-N6)-methyltransferase
MFSYRHSFHAGNHADVLKHMVLVQVIKHLLHKDKPFWVIDTHAGSGLYDLGGKHASTSGEADSGIAQLWPHRQDAQLPTAVRALLEQVAHINHGDDLAWYPGSPQLAAQMLREGDHLRLFELHPTELGLLGRHFGDVKRGVTIHAEDGFAGLKSCLPPPPRRGLVHIDPPYEMKDDYRRVVQTLREMLPRFVTGTYAIWYPQVARHESHQLPNQLKALADQLDKVDWLHATLRVKRADPSGRGLFGSGMFIINPPYTLYDRLNEALPWLVEHLGQDDHAAYSLEAQQN